ncbi:MAG TPA: tetratricopeptide repeat protein [bacterium]|nr:tetratricopeptide repeat protein [bacterium]
MNRLAARCLAALVLVLAAAVFPAAADDYAAAQALLQAGQPARAQALLDRLLIRQPDNMRARYLRGQALQQQQRWDAALNDYVQVLTVAPNDAAVHLNIGYIYLVQNQRLAARQELAAALAANPAPAVAALAHWYLFRIDETENPAAALAQVRAALQARADDWREFAPALAFLRRHDQPLALALTEKLWQQQPRPEFAVALAEQYRSAGRAAEAVLVLQAATRRWPDNAGLWRALAGEPTAAAAERMAAYRRVWQLTGERAALRQAAAVAGRPAEALACWRELLRLETTPELLLDAAAAALAAGDRAQAKYWTTDAVARRPRDARGQFLRATIAWADGDAAGAAAAAEQGLALGWDATVAERLVDQYLAAGREGQAEALAARLAAAPGGQGRAAVARIRLTQGRVRLARGEAAAAVAALQAAVAAGAAGPEMQALLGEALARSGDRVGAVAALAAAGEHPRALLVRAELARIDNDTPAYAAHLRRYLAAGGREASALVNWSLLLRQVADARLAAEFLQRHAADTAPQLWLALGAAWQDAGLPQLALPALARAATLLAAPSAELTVRLLRVHEQLGHWSQVTELARHMLRSGGDHVLAQLALARAALAGANAPAAAEHARQALALRPGLPAANCELGRALLAGRDYHGAARALRAAWGGAPAGVVALLAGRAELGARHYPEAAAALAKAQAAGMAVPAAELAAAWRGTGRAALLADRLARAEQCLTRAEAAQATMEGNWLRGRLALARGDAAGARACWTAGLQQQPGAARLQVALARLDAVTQPALALARLRQVPHLTADDYLLRSTLALAAGDSAAAGADGAAAWRGGMRTAPLALMLAALHRDSAGVEYCEQARQLAPDSPAVQEQAARLLAARGAGAQALAVCAAARQTGTATPATAQLALRLLLARGDAAGAQAWLDLVPESDAGGRELRAQVALTRGDVAQVRQLLTGLPAGREADLLRAQLLVHDGDAAGAQALFSRHAATRDQWPVSVLLAQARALAATGAADEAADACRQAARRGSLPSEAELLTLAAAAPPPAAQLFDALIALAPSPALFTAAVQAALAGHDRARARWLADDARARFGDSARMQLLAGMLAAADGDGARAEELLRAAERRDPGLAPAVAQARSAGDPLAALRAQAAAGQPVPVERALAAWRTLDRTLPAAQRETVLRELLRCAPRAAVLRAVLAGCPAVATMPDRVRAQAWLGLQCDTASAALWQAAGEGELAAGAPAAAAQSLRRARQLDPAAGMRQAGPLLVALYDAGEVAAARELLAVATDTALPVQYVRARLAEAGGDRRAADELYRRVLAREPGYRDAPLLAARLALALDEPARAAALLAGWCARHGDDGAAAREWLAAAEAANLPADADQALTVLRRQRPDDAALILRQAELRRQRGDDDGAALLLRQAAAAGVVDPAQRAELGAMLFRHAQRVSSADRQIEELREAVRYAPQLREAQLQLGRQLQARGEWADARAALMAARGADATGIAAARTLLRLAQERRARGATADAEELARALADDAAVAQAARALWGELLLARGDAAGALAAWQGLPDRVGEIAVAGGRRQAEQMRAAAAPAPAVQPAAVPVHPPVEPAVAAVPPTAPAMPPASAASPAALSAATAELERAVQRNPDDDQLRVRLARAYAADGDQAAAQQAVTAALQRRRTAPALTLAAQLATRDKEWERGVELVQEALRLAPSDFALHRLQAELLWHLDRLPEAERHARLAVNNAPDSAGYRLLGDILVGQAQPGPALAAWREALARGWPDAVGFKLQRGDAAVATGDYAAALADLLAVEQADPDNLWAQCRLGEAWAAAGALDEALPRLTRAAQAPVPETQRTALRLLTLLQVQGGDLAAARAAYARLADGDPQAARALARLELRRGDPRRAFALLAETCRRSPGAAALLLDALTAGEQAGAFAEAIALGREQAVLAADQPEYHARMARLFARAGQRDAALLELQAPGVPSAAAAAVRRLMASAPDEAVLAGEREFIAAPWRPAGGLALARATLAAGEHPARAALVHALAQGMPRQTAAVEATLGVLLGRAGLYRQALAVTDARDGYNRAWLLCQAGDPAAVELWEEQQQRQPDDPAVLNNLAVAALRQDDLERALQLLEAGVRRHGNDGLLLTNLGYCLRRAGRYEESRDMLLRAAAARPDQAAVRVTLAEVLFQTGQYRDARKLADRLQQEVADDGLRRRIEECRRLLDRQGA